MFHIALFGHGYVFWLKTCLSGFALIAVRPISTMICPSVVQVRLSQYKLNLISLVQHWNLNMIKFMPFCGSIFT